MSQKLIVGFPIPVVLGFAVLLLLLFALAGVLVAMRLAAPVRVPAQSEHGHGHIDAFDPEDKTLFRLGRLEITPLGERGRRRH